MFPASENIDFTDFFVVFLCEDREERALTFDELGKWDAKYRETMIELIREITGGEGFAELSADKKREVLREANDYAAKAARDAIGAQTDSGYLKIRAAYDEGAGLAEAVVYAALAGTVEPDRDGDGKAVSGSAMRKQIEELDAMPMTDAARGAILKAMGSEAQDMQALAGRLGNEDFYTVSRAICGEWKQTEKYARLAAAGVSESVKMDVIKTFMTDGKGEVSTSYGELEAARKNGMSLSQWAKLYAADDGAVKKYNDARTLGMGSDAAYKAAMAAASMPKPEKGKTYSNADRQRAAVDAVSGAADQLAAYIAWGSYEYPGAERAKLSVAAENYGVTPGMYLEFKAMLAAYDADGNGSYNAQEKRAALAATDYTAQQKRALWQLMDIDAKKNPWGMAKDIYEAYLRGKDADRAK